MTFPTLSFFWQATIPSIRQNGRVEAVRFFRRQFAEGFGPRMRAPNHALEPAVRCRAFESRRSLTRRRLSQSCAWSVQKPRLAADGISFQQCPSWLRLGAESVLALGIHIVEGSSDESEQSAVGKGRLHRDRSIHA